MIRSSDTPTPLSDHPSRWEPETTARLLALGQQGERRPLDDLLDRLDEKDGAEWLKRAVEETAGTGAYERLLNEAAIDECLAGKVAGKACLVEPPTPQVRLRGLATYFLSIAAGLVHHATLIGGPGRDAVNVALRELASATDEPLASWLLQAADVETR